MTKQPDDLVERLRRRCKKPEGTRKPTPRELEAADRIEADAATITALRQRVAELEGALAPFAEAWDAEEYLCQCHWSDFKHARTALERRGSE